MNISEELQKVEDWLETANELKNEIQEKGGEIIKENPYPPIWSNKLKDIPNFLKDIKEWLQDPALRRVKECILTLQQIGNDKRGFEHLSGEYLLDLTDLLRNALEKIQHIETEFLKIDAAKYLLDTLIQLSEKSEVQSALQTIEDYHSALQEKILSFDCGGSVFLETIKSDVEKTLSQTTDFTEDVDGYFQSLEQAKKAINLMKDIVSESTFVKEYKKNKDTDDIWELASSINEILRQTQPRKEYVGKRRYPLLADYKNLQGKKIKALSAPTLTEIKKELDDYKQQVSGWLGFVNNTFQDRQKKFFHWRKLLEQYRDKAPTELINDLNEITYPGIKFDSIMDISLDALAELLQQFESIEKRVEKTFKGLLDGDERRIIERGDELRKLQIEMGEKSFWANLRGVMQKIPTLTIKLKWMEEK